MNSNQTPSELAISLTDCCALASEVWRLGRHVDSLGAVSEAVSLRYSLRQLGKLLERMKIAVIDLVGHPYDPGMIQEVVEIIDDPELAPERQVINETVSPTITWNGVVVQPGQVSLRRSPYSHTELSEVSA